MHEPVLVEEVLFWLDVKKNGIYVDCTLGSGGHTKAIFEKSKIVKIYGIDRDLEAISKFKVKSSKLKVLWSNFKNLSDIINEKVNGVLFDLGVSSEQLDSSERGFSYRFDSPLDLRMDRSRGIPFFELLEKFKQDDLEFILKTYGEESRCKKIAAEIIKNKPKTTGELVEIVRRITPYRGRSRVLARVFQSLRIFVNDELDNLHYGLREASKILKKGGRVCVISYHSLEDRIVKRYFKEEPSLIVLTKKPVCPKESEIIKNRRSRSAKLRCAEKV